MQAMGLVFISAKSEDYPYAREIYEYLHARGIPVFFSPSSLSAMGDADYRRAIDRALEDAEHLIVVCSSRENVTSNWVEAEWGGFINERRSQRKTGNLITVLVGGMKVTDLPFSLRQFEVMDHSRENLERLLPYVGYDGSKANHPSIKSDPVDNRTTSNTKPGNAPVAPDGKKSKSGSLVPIIAGILAVVVICFVLVNLLFPYLYKSLIESVSEEGSDPTAEVIREDSYQTIRPENLDRLVVIAFPSDDGGGWPAPLAFSPDGSLLASIGYTDRSSGYTDDILIWNTQTWQLEHTIPEQSVNDLDFSPDGSWLLAAGCKTTSWLVSDWSVHLQLDGVGEDCIYEISTWPDSYWFVGATPFSTRKYDASSGQVMGNQSSPRDVDSVAVSFYGNMIFDTHSDKTLRQLDPNMLSVVRETSLDGRVGQLEISPADGLLAGMSNEANIIYLWDISDFSLKATFQGHASSLADISFSPDGQMLASLGDDSIALWHVNPPELLATIPINISYGFFSVTFSPDGKWMAAGSENGAVVVWGIPE